MSAIYPDLRDRTVVVTGGGSGIGEAVVRAFVSQGARVGFLDLDTDASEGLHAQLQEQGARVAYRSCDLTDIAALRTQLHSLRAELGPIRVLVNNAANDDRHRLEELTPQYFDNRVAVNLRHQLFAAQCVVPDMRSCGGGSIINMGSISWMLGVGGMVCYTTCKSAIEGMTRALARDLGGDNIRVNSIAPGWIMTERQIRLWLTRDAEVELLRRQCLKRRLSPEEVARVALFLASDEASACTNHTYIVDGGYL